MKTGLYMAKVESARSIAKQLQARLQKIQYDSRGDSHWMRNESQIARQEVIPKIQKALQEGRQELLLEQITAGVEAKDHRRPKDADSNQRRAYIMNFLQPLVIGVPFDQALANIKNVLKLGGDYTRYLEVSEDFLKLAAMQPQGENESAALAPARQLQVDRALEPYRSEEYKEALQRERFYGKMMEHHETVAGMLLNWVNEAGSGKETDEPPALFIDKMAENAQAQAELKG